MKVNETIWTITFPLFINTLMSVIAYFLSVHLISNLRDTFIKAKLYGIDLNKKDNKKIPEAVGVITGCTFLITMFFFIPIPFTNYIFDSSNFPHHEFVELLVALLSICCMVLLGFADDVLDLRWRHKLVLPTIASLPLLMVYYVNFNSTLVIIPKPLRPWIGFSINLWIFYYVYMGMLAVFCTNAINILAGINGLEVGQSLVIAISILIFNIVELSGDLWKAHQFSMYFLLPYIATSIALLKFNWYPSRVFVGDTFCYFSGMTFAVVGIIGHFSKTTLLFFIPQIFNFIYSMPQLLHLVPCPRHRLPKYNSTTDKLDLSVTVFNKRDLNMLGKFIMQIFAFFKIIRLEEDNEMIMCNNLTLINLVLIIMGPTKESTLTYILILIQVYCSLLAFVIRYPLASLFYDV
ncbi:UDP-N-acetylglucosamine--dolichyl-phosphate N-acetylglucosaminephosphotransferase [Prorops nasuta]|uniref:UDP-N-acetylglucosamine--dolichyl-phosphate N-acetylglucosaminephosphotransferase n=1 Tax=Prorops nasuta TaxID=863751 RepID=UPI0034CE5199